jgi:glyoxylase-like metal-dependent hydrolase (beta-lactamase superfamily II)
MHGTSKKPKLVFDRATIPDLTIFAFSPNRDTLGGTAYLILEETGNTLVDCPAWNETNQAFLDAQGGVKTLVITHRDAIAQVKAMQGRFGCEVLIQEQEAYLIPGVPVQSFHVEHHLSSTLHLLWTPGHTPGSSCLYHHSGVLFTGRHLLPDPQGQLSPLKTAKTFHWPRQIQSVQLLIDQFTPDTLKFICPGGNLGFLRGHLTIDNAYQSLLRCTVNQEH